MNSSRRSIKSARARLVLFGLPVLAALLVGADQPPDTGQADENTPAAQTRDGKPATATEPERPAHLVPVPLPIRGTVDTQVKAMVGKLQADAPSGGVRPILILEFRKPANGSGESSEFERCLSLARYLAGESMSGTRTVAYIPSGVTGHAVLPVLACEEIIVHPDAVFGAAGVAEPYIDGTVRRAYRETAQRRRTVPVAIALGMLDKDLSIYQVETLEGVRYVVEDELEELKQETTVSSIQSLIPPGDMGRFTGRELRLKYGFASHLASDHKQLAAALNVAVSSIEQDPSLSGQWRPTRIDVSGPINAKAVNWTLRSLRQHLNAGSSNLLCLRLDSAGGSAEDSLRLAGFLAELDATQVRTVAFVPEQARGDAALIALACDDLVIAPNAVLGGPGESEVSSRDQPELRRAIQGVAADKGRDWSLPVALVDSTLSVYRFTREGTGAVHVFCEEEVADQDDPTEWKRGAEIPASDGLSGREVEELGWATSTAENFEEFKQQYQLQEDLQFLQPNWAHMLIERLASPRLAGVLLFVAWFTMLIEFAQPGVGVAGFVSAVCFVLFFWSNFLHGTAGWLEVLLFAVGVAAVLLEILVIPGFGVFGLGGAVLIVGSIILASQTFIIPQNKYQFEQLPSSLMMVAAAGAGAVASLIVIRRYLPDAPIFRRLMLLQLDEESLDEIQRRELLADFMHLQGKRGRTTTQLTPSGKARFGDDVVNVISDGELIPSGTAVCVTEVRGNRVLVQPIDG